MASCEGGVDIEEVAETNPNAIIKLQVDPLLGLQPYQARNLAKALGLSGKMIQSAAKLITGIYKTWWECDASMVEINPLCVVENPDGTTKMAAVDAKISIDGNALYRHKNIAEMRDLNEEAELEVEASKYDLNYIKLDGNVACLVNGAGLAMATMDAIKHFGGDPANFLDVGGGATKEQVTAAFQIILKDPNVKAILVNIFGGIMNCNTIAEGVVAAAAETQLSLPLVVRLEGNNVDAGRKTLSESGITLITAASLADAAKKVVSEATV
jgi:succinyl-CoA synthetase beta subunit